MNKKLSKAEQFVKNAKKIIVADKQLANRNNDYYTCSCLTGSGIHIGNGIEKLATELGITELKVFQYEYDTEPFQKQFEYDGIKFFELLDSLEIADLIRSGAKTIQLKEVQ